MITPSDIQKKEFGKSMRGYRQDEVDMFLDLVTLDMEKLIKENSNLKQQLERTRSELEQAQHSSGEVVQVLEQAKGLMNEISESAEKRAGIIIKNAELEAETKVQEAKQKAQQLAEDQRNLKHQYEQFRDHFRRMLQEEMHRLDGLDEENRTFQPVDDGTNEDDTTLEDILQDVGDMMPEKQDSTDTERKTMVIDMKNGAGE